MPAITVLRFVMVRNGAVALASVKRTDRTKRFAHYDVWRSLPDRHVTPRFRCIAGRD